MEAKWDKGKGTIVAADPSLYDASSSSAHEHAKKDGKEITEELQVLKK